MISTIGVKTLASQISRGLSHRSPTILTVMGVAGIVGTVVLTVKATPKITEILEHEQLKKNMDLGRHEKLTVLEVVKSTWHEAVPPLLMGSAAVFCFLGANSIHLRRTAALQGVYALTETAYKEYQAKVIKTLGENKETKVREEIIQDKLDANPVSNNVVIITGEGDTLCFDATSGRYFKSHIEKLRRIQNDVNHTLLTEMWVTLNELYSEMNLEPIDLGESLGWSTDALIDIIFTSKLTDTGEPCLVLTHRIMPSIYRN